MCSRHCPFAVTVCYSGLKVAAKLGGALPCATRNGIIQSIRSGEVNLPQHYGERTLGWTEGGANQKAARGCRQSARDTQAHERVYKSPRGRGRE